MSQVFTSIKEASMKWTMTSSNKPRGLKHKPDYDKEEETDTVEEEEQQMMEINWTQMTLTKSMIRFRYGAYSAPKVVQ